MDQFNAHKIILLSGKRKSGKDYIAERLLKAINNNINSGPRNDDSKSTPATAVILRISGPLKKEYAKRHNLNLAELLSSSEYKEIYRKAMVEWSERVRSRDPGFFIRAAVQDFLDSEMKNSGSRSEDAKNISQNCSLSAIAAQGSDLGHHNSAISNLAGDSTKDMVRTGMSNNDVIHCTVTNNDSTASTGTVSTKSSNLVIIFSDIRRKSDIAVFRDLFGHPLSSNKKLLTVRIWADPGVRNQRGWIFTPGIDDAETECDLDDFPDWDFCFANNGTQKDLDEQIAGLIAML